MIDITVVIKNFNLIIRLEYLIYKTDKFWLIKLEKAVVRFKNY